MSDKTNLLDNLYFGNFIAEDDDLLDTCFVTHTCLNDLIKDRKDIILGAKGSGKSAVLREIESNSKKYQEQIGNVVLKRLINPNGDPEFREVLNALSKDSAPDTNQLRGAWKIYLLGQFFYAAKSALSDKDLIADATKEFIKYGIIDSHSPSIRDAFAFSLAKAQALTGKITHWAERLGFQFSKEAIEAGKSLAGIPFNELFRKLSVALEKENKRIWIALDRLDEIVLDNIDIENVTLKGLLLAYRDLSEYKNIRIKIFLRDDVYERITTLGEFPALTHVNARATRPIKWGLEDLRLLVMLRLAENDELVESLGLNKENFFETEYRDLIMYSIIPEKIDKGNSAESFKWVIDRITDSNDVATPRDLLVTLDKARVIQSEELRLDPDSLNDDLLFSESTFRKAVKEAAKDNLNTRIYAEYPDLRGHIEKFREGKADHDDKTLKDLLGSEWPNILSRLKSIGFINKRTRDGIEMWTIPFFYSFALDIKRGAAFDLPKQK